MQLPDDVKAIRARYVAAFPVPTGAPGPDHEERVRQWTILFAEQVAFDLPGQGYGVKRADGGRPIGKDSLARKVGDRIDGWDLLLGAGDGAPELADDPAYHDISDQVFVPVTPTNHLGSPEPEPEPEPQPDPVPVDLSALLAQLQRMSAQLEDAVEASKDAKAAALLALSVARDLFNRPIPEPVKAPIYTVRAWGRTIATATPDGQ